MALESYKGPGLASFAPERLSCIIRTLGMKVLHVHLISYMPFQRDKE